MNGVILIDKEQDWTSNDVVSKLKGILRERRIGHSGTLDPMATGLLVVFVGRATRAVEFAEGHDKSYRAGLRLGMLTDTQDITGTVLESKPCDIREDALRAVLEEFKGEQLQLPPMYSAIKVKGKRLYDIARAGGEVERKKRPITIHDISLVGREGEDYIIDVSCSKGTYVRTICHDIGQSLGCGGCMSALRRVKAGGFSVQQAHKLSEVQRYADKGRAEELLIPVDELFCGYEKCSATAAEEKRIRCGNDYKTVLSDGEYRVYSQSGEFLMLGRAEKGMMKTIKSFFEV